MIILVSSIFIAPLLLSLLLLLLYNIIHPLATRHHPSLHFSIISPSVHHFITPFSPDIHTWIIISHSVIPHSIIPHQSIRRRLIFPYSLLFLYHRSPHWECWSLHHCSIAPRLHHAITPSLLHHCSSRLYQAMITFILDFWEKDLHTLATCCQWNCSNPSSSAIIIS